MNLKTAKSGSGLESAGAAVETAPAKKRVFIVDDHAMFRDGLRRLIEMEDDLAVCGDAPDAETGLRELPTAGADLVIVDISLDETNGIDLLKSIKRDYEDLPVLVVSMHSETLYGDRALRAGAMGYVMKSEPAATVIGAIRKVLGGNVHISERMATLVVSKLARGELDQTPSPAEALSDREMEVFRMLGQGKGTREIAQEMNVALPTISSFKNRIKEKLNFKNSTEMILFSLQWFKQEKPER
jgi:DNA-binding NarL/FixJ family response regulator